METPTAYSQQRAVHFLFNIASTLLSLQLSDIISVDPAKPSIILGYVYNIYKIEKY